MGRAKFSAFAVGNPGTGAARVAVLIVRLLHRGAAAPPDTLDATVVVSYLGPRLDAE